MSNTDGAAPAAASTGPLSISDAVGILNQPPKEREENTASATADEAGATEQESAPQGEDDAAAVEEQPPGETDGDDAAGEDQPPIEAPKSWTKAEREAFASLPREHQQAIADREREREAYYRKGHDEAAQRAKAAEAREQAAEQKRQQYEQALPNLLQQFSAQFQAEFQDIKTWDDVAEMRKNDPMRFMAWQEAREKGQVLQRETQAAQQRQQQEAAQRWTEFASNEDKAFLDKAPELADPKVAAERGAEAKSLLVDLGFRDDELAGLWNGQNGITLRDHRIQLLVRDALNYRRAQAAAKVAAKKTVPPVQRPGTAPVKGEAVNAAIKTLDDKLSRTGRMEDAVALLNARSRKRA